MENENNISPEVVVKPNQNKHLQKEERTVRDKPIPTPALISKRRVLVWLGQLVFFSVCGVLGYMLTDHLSRENISIEEARISPEMGLYKLNRNLLAEVKMESGKIHGLNSFGGFVLPDFEEYIDQGQIQHLQNNLESRRASAEVLNKSLDAWISEIKSTKNDLTFDEMVSITKHSYIPFISARRDSENEPTKTDVLRALSEWKEQNLIYLGSINKLLTELKGHNPQRVGTFDIVITVLNNGDTDGLIKRKGFLIVTSRPGDKPLPIVLKSHSYIRQNSWAYSPYVQTPNNTISSKVEKRSIVELTFVLDKSDGISKGSENVEAMVKKKDPFNFKVRLTDFRDQVIESDVYSLEVIDP